MSIARLPTPCLLVSAITLGISAMIAFLALSTPVPRMLAMPVPMPRAQMLTSTIAATVVVADDDLLGVQEAGGAGPVAFLVARNVAIMRDGARAELEALRSGDVVQLTVDRRTNHIIGIATSPASRRGPSDLQALLAAVGLLGGALALWIRRRPLTGLLTAPLRWLPFSGEERIGKFGSALT
jgi:hypothetical protein